VVKNTHHRLLRLTPIKLKEKIGDEKICPADYADFHLMEKKICGNLYKSVVKKICTQITQNIKI
jgi:agmatine/peptidylarginine deiminase